MQCQLDLGPQCHAMAMMWSWYYISFTMQSLCLRVLAIVICSLSYCHAPSVLTCICYGVMLLYNNTMQSSFVSAKHNGLHLHFGHVNCRYSYMSCACISSIHRCSQYKATAAMGLMFSMMGCIVTCVSIFWYSLYCCGCTSYWSCENLCLA